MPDSAWTQMADAAGKRPGSVADVWKMREALGPRGSLRCLERLHVRLRPDAPRLQRLAVLVPLAFLRYRAGRLADARALWAELLPDRRQQLDPLGIDTTAVSDECTRHVQALLNLEVADYWRSDARRGMTQQAGPVLDALEALGPAEEPGLDAFVAVQKRQALIGPVQKVLAFGESDVVEPLSFLDLLESYAAARRAAPAAQAEIFNPHFAACCRRLVVLGWVAGPRGAYMASCLCSTSVHLFRRGLVKLSWSACRQALQLRLENLGDRHPLYGIRCANMAATLIELGRLRAAEPLLHKALEITPDFHHPWYWLARLYGARNGPGDRRCEVRAWQRYLGLNSTFPERVDEAWQRLKGVTLSWKRPRARVG